MSVSSRVFLHAFSSSTQHVPRPAFTPSPPPALLTNTKNSTYLWLNQHQVNKQYHEIMLNVFIAEASAVLAHREPDVVAGRRARGAAAAAAGVVLCPECLHRVLAFNADGHVAVFYCREPCKASRCVVSESWFVYCCVTASDLSLFLSVSSVRPSTR